MSIFTDEYFMRQALAEAQQAMEAGEIPVGAVVTFGDRLIARAHNLTEALQDPTAHAEMQAITAATQQVGGKYLKDCTLYVSLEPCPMCAGALYWAQVGRLVYASADPKRGYSQVSTKLLHPKTEVKTGVLAAEASGLLQHFFQLKRN